MLVASLLAGFFNYLYQLSMGRLLPPEDYGVLISLLSLLYIFSMLSVTINTSAAKFTSVYKVKGEYGRIKVMLFKVSRGLSLLVLLLVAILLILSPYIAAFLDVDLFLVFVLVLAIPPLLILPVPQGILRGLQRFVALGTSNVSRAVVKFLGFVCHRGFWSTWRLDWRRSGTCVRLNFSVCFPTGHYWA
jgi:O-antigen/teichoic acid export membrane protein